MRPEIGVCPVCSEQFSFPVRKQGGGARRKYCSSKCRSLDWVRGNGGKRKASILKYDTQPENKEKKRLRTRKSTLQKYGWTHERFLAQLTRQQHSCAGCLQPLTKEGARIDHDHVTGEVRGLLCDHCNWVLGHAKDQPGTLRRLMSYLDRDWSKTLVYLIGALKNQRIPDIGNLLRNQDYDVMDEWFTPGELADLNLQEYERRRGRTYSEALAGRAVQNIFWFDRSYIDLSDIVVLVMPAGKSAMLELGYAKGRGKQTAIFLDGVDPERYDIMPRFADQIFKTETDLIEGLSKWRCDTTIKSSYKRDHLPEGSH